MAATSKAAAAAASQTEAASVSLPSEKSAMMQHGEEGKGKGLRTACGGECV
jgi:hypothetical protein